MASLDSIPKHLQKYIVAQEQDEYSPQEHATWRFILRQLKDYLSGTAQNFYLEGLEKTGITIESIPSIQDISDKIEEVGWRAIPVSGFIPPAAFMEMQSLGLLPIAKEIRSIDHIPYTPAPDIVHEAAGHAPFLANKEYSDYLHQYAIIAKKCIISSEDYNIYNAIRELSDIKENPQATQQEIVQAEKKLSDTTNSMTYISEANKVGRMNWWTAEYGLIGSLDSPKIFGAGLLSSIGESKSCLLPKVRKLPLSVDCINYSYDITEPQPQLFVAKDFSHLKSVLNDMANDFAFKRGGKYGLDEAIKAKNVNTVELDSGIQISGKLARYREDSTGVPCYLHFVEGTQLCTKEKQLDRHGKLYHAEGFGSPIGKLKGLNICLSNAKKDKLEQVGIQKNKEVNLSYHSGIEVNGTVTDLLFSENKLLLISFENCKVTLDKEVLFAPDWGNYDMAVGCTVSSVFGGPADREAYGESEDFSAVKIKKPKESELKTWLNTKYQELRETRIMFLRNEISKEDLFHFLTKFVETTNTKASEEWLLFIEVLELANQLDQVPKWKQGILAKVKKYASKHTHLSEHIHNGLRLSSNLII